MLQVSGHSDVKTKFSSDNWGVAARTIIRKPQIRDICVKLQELSIEIDVVAGNINSWTNNIATV